ncbi:MAG: sigma-54 dependent transcriptional regulator [Gemmatimonadota bacterium]
MKGEAILVIEDEALLGEELVRHFTREGWEAARAVDVAQARAVLKAGALQPLVVLSDLSLPDGSGLDLLEERREAGDGSAWVFLTGYGTVPESVRALQLGAIDFLQKPVPLDRLDLVVESAARSARAERRLREASKGHHDRYTPDAFLGTSSAAQEVRSLVGRIAGVPFTSVLIEGETGTGKGLVARILHYSGDRREGPLVEVNCAALPSELMESELFGHEAGAFTGARTRHRGFFEQASGGSLFLDEVSEMPPPLQAKLLKAVEDRRIRRVGGEKEIDVDVQVIAASNAALDDAVARGDFRADLYHRMAVLKIELPALRERKADIRELTWAAVAEFNARAGHAVTSIPDSVWERLEAYRWPGNVRELRNVLERSVLLATSSVLSDRWLGLPRSSERPLPTEPDAVVLRLDGSTSFDEIEAHVLARALELSEGNVSAAARLLGMTRQTLRYRIEKFGLTGDDAEDGAV